MMLLRLLFWPLLLLPAAWYAWQALHAPPRATELENGARLEWGDCWFETSYWRPVHCARLLTAPDAEGVPARFALPVVYLSQYAWRRTMPPVLYIAGGPGGAAWLESDEMDFWLDWAEQMDWPGDLILYDQRGVGLSQPALDCPELYEARRELLPLPLPTEEIYQRVHAASEACQQRLLGEGIDLTRFTTERNAADAIDLMRALGFEQWAVYGVSYGTRVALQMLRAAPRHVTAAVLDSVYPPQINAELADAWLLQRSLELFARICELADDCKQTPEQLSARLERAFARVEQEKIRVSVRDPEGGRDLAVVYDHEDLAWLLFEAMYQAEVVPALPEAVLALAQGRLDGVMRALIQDSVDAMLDDTISDAVSVSVDCHDAAPVDASDAQRQLDLYPGVADIKRFDWQYHSCRFWRSGDAGMAFRQPVESGVPTLLLAGEFDPVTPPEWAELAAASLERGAVFVFPAIGHGVLDSHPCAADLVRSFFASPEAVRPPNCLSDL